MIISLLEFLSLVILLATAVHLVNGAAKKIFAISKEKEIKSILSGDVDPKLKAPFLKLIKLAKKRLNKSELDKVYSIQKNILLIKGHVRTTSQFNEELFTIDKIANDYLPTTVNAYLELTPEFVDTQMVGNNKTARALFLEQLEVLEDHTFKTLDAVNHKNAQALRIQNEFLKSKFSNHNWLD